MKLVDFFKKKNNWESLICKAKVNLQKVELMILLKRGVWLIIFFFFLLSKIKEKKRKKKRKCLCVGSHNLALEETLPS